MGKCQCAYRRASAVNDQYEAYLGLLQLAFLQDFEQRITRSGLKQQQHC